MTPAALRIENLITTETDKKFELPGRMASAVLEIAHLKGDCHPHDLNGKGFSEDEVRDLWHMAQSLAAVEVRLMEEL